MLLPDLIPWLSQANGFVYDWTVQGNELRLSTAVANIGLGNMELRGGAVHGDSQDVMQRIYAADGSFTDLLAGSFTYHEEHGHIHFDEFAEFRLREVTIDGGVGAVVATGGKVSFCLIDVEQYGGAGTPAQQYLTCGQVQGISAGWADVYNRGLAGQSIDITSVVNGNYWLEVVVDPSNRLIEADEANNVGRIPILLNRTGGPPFGADAFEFNDSFATASVLAPPEDHTYDNLTIHAAYNGDFFRVTASASGLLTFKLAFQHALGDVDLEVYNSTQTLLFRSESVDNSESVTVSALAGEFFFVRVYGYNGATNPGYSFTVDQPDHHGTTGDALEENDSFATARILATADLTYANLSIDTVGDDDYYSVVATSSGTLTVSLAFLHALGDVDLAIFNAAQTQLAKSDSVSNSEQVSIQVTAGQTYSIRVYGYNRAVNPNYSMTIDVPGTGGQGVVTAPVDTDAAANAVLENAAIGSVVGLTAFASDPNPADTVTYSLTSNPGNLFAINPTTGVVTVAAAIDRETVGPTVNVQVTAISTDSSRADRTSTIAIGDADEFNVTAPADLNAAANTVIEGAATGAQVGITATAADADATLNAVSYSLINSAGGRFAINATTGVVTVANGTLLNATTSALHQITVQATSADGSVATSTFDIAVTVRPNSAPVITSNGGSATATVSIAENSNAVTTVAATDVDAGQTLGYSIVGGADANLFTLDATSHALRFVTAPDFELPDDNGAGNRYDVIVGVSDGRGGTDSQAITVTVSNVAGLVQTSNAATLSGTIEPDTLRGGAAANTILGLGGNDALYGAGGADVLDGGVGNDSLYGGSENDTLTGGLGNDLMDGGSGNDSFVFAAGFGTDVIAGFDADPSGGQDTIRLSGFGITAASFAARVIITDVGADTLVTIDGNVLQTIRLSGIGNAATVTVDDFVLL